MKCLLIETKDKRKFFTSKKNLMQLNEFSKTFDSNIFIVEIQKGKLLELDELAAALCNAEYMADGYDYKVINQIKTKKVKEKTSQKTNIGSKIEEFITKELIARKPISIKKVKSKFKKYTISDATVYNKLKKAKLDLEKKGFKFLKVKTGVYKAK
jgi:hypothetical protein